MGASCNLAEFSVFFNVVSSLVKPECLQINKLNSVDLVFPGTSAAILHCSQNASCEQNGGSIRIYELLILKLRFLQNFNMCRKNWLNLTFFFFLHQSIVISQNLWMDWIGGDLKNNLVPSPLPWAKIPPSDDQRAGWESWDSSA